MDGLRSVNSYAAPPPLALPPLPSHVTSFSVIQIALGLLGNGFQKRGTLESE